MVDLFGFLGSFLGPIRPLLAPMLFVVNLGVSVRYWLPQVGEFDLSRVNLLGWAGHLPDHLADLAARAPKPKNVTVVAPRTT